ncbi:hypothetical protein [Streptomyces anulatus]|uniref:hypothetical protein n=1 Tax=Streptomyces anulatus TaxID=1892 RepID=UPI0033CAE274
MASGLGAVLAGRQPAATVFDGPVKNWNLPLARARDLGAARAVERGAELLEPHPGQPAPPTRELRRSEDYTLL